MTKKKIKNDTSIEEVDLFSLDINSLDLDLGKLDTKKPSITKPSKKSTRNETPEVKEKTDENEENDEFFEAFKDEFKDDFDDDFDFDGDLIDDEKIDDYVGPKDFFTDKRRQKNLKKFLDVEVPAEYLEGLSEDMVLLFKKGKVEGKLVYDEVINALPVGDDIEFMDEVFSRLAKLKIELVDSLDQEDVFKDSGKKNEEIDLAEISDDSIRMYLNEIGRFKLIDGDEEIRLGRLIQK